MCLDDGGFWSQGWYMLLVLCIDFPTPIGSSFLSMPSGVDLIPFSFSAMLMTSTSVTHVPIIVGETSSTCHHVRKKTLGTLIGLMYVASERTLSNAIVRGGRWECV